MLFFQAIKRKRKRLTAKRISLFSLLACVVTEKFFATHKQELNRIQPNDCFFLPMSGPIRAQNFPTYNCFVYPIEFSSLSPCVGVISCFQIHYLMSIYLNKFFQAKWPKKRESFSCTKKTYATWLLASYLHIIYLAFYSLKRTVENLTALEKTEKFSSLFFFFFSLKRWSLYLDLDQKAQNMICVVYSLLRDTHSHSKHTRTR